MHTKPMSETEGTFNDNWKALPDRTCPKCDVKGQSFYRTWESSDGAYEDEKVECRACGKVVWIEGSDA